MHFYNLSYYLPLLIPLDYCTTCSGRETWTIRDIMSFKMNNGVIFVKVTLTAPLTSRHTRNPPKISDAGVQITHSTMRLAEAPRL